VHTAGKVPERSRQRGHACTHARGVAEQADIVITMVPDTPDVERCCSARRRRAGPDEGQDGGRHELDLADRDQGFAERINALGCDYLDAPVSGGEVGAKAATLTIMVGGAQAAFERVKPLFELMGKNITLVGGNGDGQTDQGGRTRSSSR
jgi:2-hydroxy-3-oxopropionate reductase